MTATRIGAAADGPCRRRDRRRDRLSGARRYGVRRSRFASATFGMAHFKAAAVRRAGATRAGAAAEWIGSHFVLTDPVMLCPPDQIWSDRGIVKLHYLRRLHPNWVRCLIAHPLFSAQQLNACTASKPTKGTDWQPWGQHSIQFNDQWPICFTWTEGPMSKSWFSLANCLATTMGCGSACGRASDWPICAISETAAPHRMGAALTYARRYALFTLVGIAGEDDLDAPDLIAPTTASRRSEPPAGKMTGGLNGRPGHRDNAFSRSGQQSEQSIATRLLDPDGSAALRERLVIELNRLSSADEAATWGLQALTARNTLLPADAERVENAFKVQLSKLASEAAAGQSARRSRVRHPHKRSAVDKTVLSLPTPRRVRDREHVESVSKQPCLVCGRRPADVHHLRFA